MTREHNGECSSEASSGWSQLAMCNQAALVRLLISKGLFTMEEYSAEVLAEMEREVERYEKRIDPSGRTHLA